MVELVLAVALALSKQPVVVECGPLPFQTLSDGAANPGPPPHIYLRWYVCKQAVNGKHYGLRVLAHEILHVRNFSRADEWVQKWDDWYAENVVRWKMRRIAARGP